MTLGFARVLCAPMFRPRNMPLPKLWTERLERLKGYSADVTLLGSM